MSAQPKYITQSEFDSALAAFSGHVDHVINMVKADFRREITNSEDRVIAKINEVKTNLEARIGSLEGEVAELKTEVAELKTEVAELKTEVAELKLENQSLRAEMNEMNQRLDRVESVGKANHQMLQIAIQHFSKINEQLDKINKKLGID